MFNLVHQDWDVANLQAQKLPSGFTPNPDFSWMPRSYAFLPFSGSVNSKGTPPSQGWMRYMNWTWHLSHCLGFVQLDGWSLKWTFGQWQNEYCVCVLMWLNKVGHVFSYAQFTHARVRKQHACVRTSSWNWQIHGLHMIQRSWWVIDESFPMKMNVTWGGVSPPVSLI